MFLQQLELKRAHEARGLAQDRDDPCGRLHLRDRPGSRVGLQVGGRGLSDALLWTRRLKQGQVLLIGAGEVARWLWFELKAQVACEEPWLLQLGHVDLRVTPQHLVQSGRSTLVVTDDEEVRDSHLRNARSS